MELSLTFVLLLVFAYLLGSISSAIIVCKLWGLTDPRTTGSKNPGATNVKRIGGTKPAAVTLLGDMLKGVIPVAIALMFFDTQQAALVGLAAFLGHLFPVFFAFQGGKGVATYLGVLWTLNWVSGLLVTLVWVVMAKGFKLSSLAAIVSMPLAPIFLYWQSQNLWVSGIFTLMAALLLYRHKSNIIRIINKQESQVKAD